MAKLPPPVIIVPGITATYLRDEYPLPHDYPWTVMTKDFRRLGLHPDDPRLEAQQPTRIRPGQVYEIAYRELIEALRHDLTVKADAPVPVFPFGYDWRQPIERSAAELGLFVQEVIDRTRLLRHYDRGGYGEAPKVCMIGHSMGGLVIASHLAANPTTHRVAKVATLATPFRGSCEPVLKITTGTAELGGDAPSSAEREAARMTPALYQLLPSYAGALSVPAGSGLPADFFDPGAWQPSVLQSLAEYVRSYGLQKTDAKGQAASLLQRLLQGARDHRAQLEALTLDAVGLTPSDWLCVVGVNSKTRMRIQAQATPAGARFNLTSEDRTNQWTAEAPHWNTGDGTVPLAGAIPAFLPPESIVCVEPGDYGYWEVQDKLTTQVAGFHGIMPNMDMLHRLIVRHLRGLPDGYGNTWGRGLPGITRAAWRPPLPLEWPTD